MIDEVLDRLLHRRSYLARFLDDPSALDLDPEDLAALATLDRTELAATAAAVRADLVRRRHRGTGSLAEMYAKTIGDRDLDALAADYMESVEFDGYREVPFAGIGLSLEESFYRYCARAGIGEAAPREAEFLTAMLKALVTSPRPDFVLPAEVRRCPRGHFAIGGSTLYAAVASTPNGPPSFVVGPVTPFVIALLAAEEAPAAIAERHGLSAEERDAALAELRALGLLA